MKIITVEPTPSPYVMKVVIDGCWLSRDKRQYTKDVKEGVPPVLKKLLQMPSIQSIYCAENFLSVERTEQASWEKIISAIDAILMEYETSERRDDEQCIYIQTYKRIPVQIKIVSHKEEHLYRLSERFQWAAQRVRSAETARYIVHRKWHYVGTRYGSVEQVANIVLDELEESYSNDRLHFAVLLEEEEEVDENLYSIEQFECHSWEERLALLQTIFRPNITHLPLLKKAAHDIHPSVRRYAAALLGLIDDCSVVPYLSRLVLYDPSWSVRRAAGDSMSELGYHSFESAMIRALGDKHRYVRWRAAKFLYERGTRQALPALYAMENDPAFEVRLQICLAIHQIEGGSHVKGSIWKQVATKRDHE